MKLSIPKLTRVFSTSSVGFGNSPTRSIFTALAVFGSLALAQPASAKAPNGIYKFTSGTGKIELGGQPFVLKKTRLKEIGSVKNGSVTVKDGEITIDRDAARNIIKDIVEVSPQLTIKGPLTLTFKKSGASYIASPRNPVVANLSADVSGETLAGVLRSRFDAKITGGKLVINVKFDGKLGFVGSIDQRQIEGSATIICNR